MRARSTSHCAALFAIAAAGCSASVGHGNLSDVAVDAAPTPDATAIPDTAIDASDALIPETDSGPDPTACAAQATALTRTLSSGGSTCTSVVRLAFETRRILGYQITCGAYRPTSQTEAARTADAVLPMLRFAPPRLTYTEDGAWLFHRAASDIGGVVMVSASNGIPVFAARIIQVGRGDITLPAAWLAPSGLLTRCRTHARIAPRSGYDLSAEEALTPLPEADIDAALAVVETTALPDALERVHSLSNAVVLRYQRQVAIGIRPDDEWIVLLNSRHLE